MYHYRIVWEDEAKAREVEILVDYTILGGLAQVGAIRPTKVTMYNPATKQVARELRVWTATGRRLLRRSFLKNHMGYVSLQREIQTALDQREVVSVA